MVFISIFSYYHHQYWFGSAGLRVCVPSMHVMSACMGTWGMHTVGKKTSLLNIHQYSLAALILVIYLYDKIVIASFTN